MIQLGDYAPGETVNFLWPTFGLSGGSITRGTDGTGSVYKDASDTQTTTGVTITEDVDGTTGLHRAVIATTDSFYTPGSVFFVMMTGMVIDGQTINAPIATFTIGRTGIKGRGTAQSATASTIVLASASAFGDDIPNGWLVEIVSGTGLGQARYITDYVTSSDTATVSPDWTTTPDSTSVYNLWAGAPGPTSAAGVPSVNVTHWLGTAAATPTVAGVPEVDVTHIGGTAATSAAGIPEVKVASIAASAITAASIATDAIDNDALAANAVTEIAAGVLTVALTESYATDGAAPTLSQAVFAIQQFLQEKAISGTTLTVKKLDGSTTAMTFTLNDATTPTSVTRAS